LLPLLVDLYIFHFFVASPSSDAQHETAEENRRTISGELALANPKKAEKPRSVLRNNRAH